MVRKHHQCSGHTQEIVGDRGAQWATIHGVTESHRYETEQQWGFELVLL